MDGPSSLSLCSIRNRAPPSSDVPKSSLGVPRLMDRRIVHGYLSSPANARHEFVWKVVTSAPPGDMPINCRSRNLRLVPNISRWFRGCVSGHFTCISLRSDFQSIESPLKHGHQASRAEALIDRPISGDRIRVQNMPLQRVFARYNYQVRG